MARPATVSRPPVADADTDTILDWFRENARLLIIGGVVVVAALLGFWFYTQSRLLRATNAERTLMSAQQAMAQGNIPLAQTDLQTVTTRYRGTPATGQAALLLAQIHYDQGQYEEGIRTLESVAGTRGTALMRPTFEALIADGYLELSNAAEAARHYQNAARETRFVADRDMYLAQAARAHVAAGDTAAALSIWQGMADDPQSPVSAEARVRLGELMAAPVRGS
ncbi:MAG TPA: tetratricopeptide repeat protein [Gemmatimonadaceae bacterium]|nr:tetratricopeptide repeat protein [Gemmatimonadaceae bacterium]